MATSVYLLGQPFVEQDGKPVSADTRKALALLAVLAVSREAQSREVLAALLWPEMSDERARAALRRTLSALRALIGEEAIVANRETIALSTDPRLWLDLWQFEDAVTEAEHHHRAGDLLCAGCLTILRSAVALYRDDFLQGFTLRDSAEFDDWQAGQAERMRRHLTLALNQLVTSLSSLGQFEEAIAYAQRWLEIDPLREDAHRWLMQLYAWNGARDLALRQYRDVVRVLDTELGVQPLPETTGLYEAIQEGRLIAPPIVPGTEAQNLPPERDTSGPSIAAAPLIGRQAAWEAIMYAYEQVGEAGQVVMVVGEPGIGKSRLAGTFLNHERQLGATVAIGACYEGESNLTYAPFSDVLRHLISLPEQQPHLRDLPPAWLSEASRLAPELQQITGQVVPPPEVSGPGAQARFFAALSEVLCSLLAGSLPGILFLDDVHWADDASLDFLAYLTRRLRELPFCLVVAWTDDGRANDNRLRRLTAEANRAGNGHLIELPRWQRADVAALVESSDIARPLPEDLSERLYRETEGLPFFVVEYLNALATNPQDSWSMPQTVRDLLAGRLANLDQTSLQLLQTAAVIGRSFDYDSLWAASGRSEEEVVAGLEHLLDHGIIREAPGRDNRDLRYDFSHQQLRSAVYEGIHLARRLLLHRRVATALVAQARAPQSANNASLIGYHYRLAGQDTLAAEYYLHAGEFARSLFANREALGHYETALALGYDDSALLQEAMGDLHTLLGEYKAALHAYQSAAAQVNGAELARLEHKLGQVYERRGEWELADSLLRAALDSYPPGMTAEAALVTVDRSRVAHRSGRRDQSAVLAAEALTLAESCDDPLAQALAHNSLGILAGQQGDKEAALLHLTRSLTLSEETSNGAVRVAALNNLARLHGRSGNVQAALELIEQALQLCRREGDRHHEAALLNHRADLLHQIGREDESMSSLKEAVAIYADIGLEAGNWQPEIWKLTEW